MLDGINCQRSTWRICHSHYHGATTRLSGMDGVGYEPAQTDQLHIVIASYHLAFSTLEKNDDTTET